MILLDTNAFIWWLSGPEALGPDAKKAIAASTVLLSAAVAWELAILIRLGRQSFPLEAALAAADRALMIRLPISDAHLVAFTSLPQHSDHRDPFDRLLVAQASVEGCALMSSDRRVARYGIDILNPKS